MIIAIIIVVTILVTGAILIWISDDLLESDAFNAQSRSTECHHDGWIVLHAIDPDPTTHYMFCGLCNTASDIPKSWIMLPLREIYMR